MISRRNNKGFTIIELLIVIVIIAILATIGVVAYGSVQKNARDSKRKSDISSLHTGLEAFFVQEQRYPTATEINDATFRDTYLKGIPDDTFKDPKDTDSLVDTSTTTPTNQYAYVPLPTGCDNGTNPCLEYTLAATLESDGSQETRTNTQ